jgi:NAD(P)-dependent dehydrogenase (short-subunit alcohol dehydrogenase family)
MMGPCDDAAWPLMFDLSGRNVVVTGGGRGIGRGIARAMVRAGADVTICGRSEGPLRETSSELTALGGRVQHLIIDITSPADLSRLVRESLDFGSGVLDCWVNNAGSASPSDIGPLLEMTEKQWDAVVDLNLKWTFFACQAAATAMADRGGSIINISSRSGSQPNPMTGQYGAAKAGVENLTATMAAEWGHLGIRVNAVAPGVVVTENSDQGSMRSESRRLRQISTIPLRRLGTADDIGPACVYLASDEASWTTGETIQITGGSRIPVGYLTYLHRVHAKDSPSEGAQ